MTKTLTILEQAYKARSARGVTRSGDSERSSPFPQVLTVGESLKPSLTKIDWLTVTFAPDPEEIIARNVFAMLQTLMGNLMGEECPGMLGYDYGVRYYAVCGGQHISVARLDFGGAKKGNRARLDISGTGCSIISAWGLLSGWVQQFEAPKITRIDLAVDCLEGEFTVDHAVEWYKSGEFSTGGSMPRHQTAGDWLTSPSVYGRTLNIGRRENGKMLRIYEKGKQLGNDSSAWVRWEVELRCKDREVPFDAITSPDTYFAGAYKCLDRVLPCAGTRIKTDQKQGLISVQSAIEYAKTGYGQLLYCLKEFMTPDEILESVARAGVPKRLERVALGGFFNGSHFQDPQTRGF